MTDLPTDHAEPMETATRPASTSPPPPTKDFNRQIIDEFRAHGGRVGGEFEGVPLLLLTTQGARSGALHTTPLAYLRDGKRLVVFASNFGLPRHPDWYHNLRAHPQVIIEVGEAAQVKTYSAVAVLVEGDERDRYLALQVQRVPRFAEYPAKTTRPLPVIALNLVDLTVPNKERDRAIAMNLLQSHEELRGSLRTLRASIDDALAGNGRSVTFDAAAERDLMTHCLTFCTHLQVHHVREDGGFTALEEVSPHLAPVILQLRREHHVVAESLAQIRGIAERIENGADEAELVTLRTELVELTSTLEDHFAKEERHLLPALGVPR